MKATIIVLFCLMFVPVFSQTDRHGNPVFNSEVISEEEYAGYKVNVLYYSIDNNIDNKKSSVYISDDPSLKDYLRFSTGLPAYVFIIGKEGKIPDGQTVINVKYSIMVSPIKRGEFFYLVSDGKNTTINEVTSKFEGDIFENRAKELIEIEADRSAKISEKDGIKKLSFHKGEYRIISFSSIKNEVYKLLDEISGKTEKKKSGSIIDFIKKESIGGGLDYEKSLDKTKLYEFNDILYSQPEASIYLWAKGVKKLGIESESEAIKLYEEIYKKTLEGGMKKAFIAGFNSK